MSEQHDMLGRAICRDCGATRATEEDMKRAHDKSLPDDVQPWEAALCWAHTPDGPHGRRSALPQNQKDEEAFAEIVSADTLESLRGHTPGPWTYRVSASDVVVYVEGPHSRGTPWLVAVPEGRGREEDLANAKLIAAAPTLLAEVESLRAERDRLRSALLWALGEAPLPDGRWFDREAFGYGKPDAHDQNPDSPVGMYWWRIPLRLYAGLEDRASTPAPKEPPKQLEEIVSVLGELHSVWHQRPKGFEAAQAKGERLEGIVDRLRALAEKHSLAVPTKEET